jgi:hypothetical protein
MNFGKNCGVGTTDQSDGPLVNHYRHHSVTVSHSITESPVSIYSFAVPADSADTHYTLSFLMHRAFRQVTIVC